MRLLAGASGFSYAPWRGRFYPARLPAARMLAFYATRLPAVEINNTFYRLPREDLLRSWAGQVPPGFRFALKASRRITHIRRLIGAESETAFLLKSAAALGDRLGPILFQLPPTLAKDLDRLRTFLVALPRVPEGPSRPAIAFEFRHESWADEEVQAILREHGAALCLADTDEAPAGPIAVTARWGYLRLRRSGYTDADLEDWLERARRAGWDEAYVFFKHEDEAEAPRLAARFLQLASAGPPAGEPAARPRGPLPPSSPAEAAPAAPATRRRRRSRPRSRPTPKPGI